jgi:hypothetical protein
MFDVKIPEVQCDCFVVLQWNQFQVNFLKVKLIK